MSFQLPQFIIPDGAKLPATPNPNLASDFYERLIKMIGEFEEELDEEHEAGVRLVTFGHSLTFQVERLGYYNPSLIRFYGRLENGSAVELIQHVSQISFLLTAMKKPDPDKPAKRIGFLSENRFEKEDAS